MQKYTFFSSCLADMEENNLLLNIITEPTTIPTAKKAVVGHEREIRWENFHCFIETKTGCGGR